MSVPSRYVFVFYRKKKLNVSKGKRKEKNKECAHKFISKRLSLNLGQQLSIVTQCFWSNGKVHYGGSTRSVSKYW